MTQLRQDYDLITQRDTIILVIGPERPQAFQQYWRQQDLPFIGLPDPEARVLKLYGQEVNLFKFGRMPAQIIIDKAGIVRCVHYGKSMADIPKTKEILQLLDQLHQEHIS